MGKVWTNLEQNQDATNDRNDAENHRKSSQNSSREGPQDSPSRSQHPPRAPSSAGKPHVTQQVPKKSRKSAQSRPKEAILGPRRDPKIDQNRARGRKSRSRRPFFAVFSAVAHGSRFSHRCGVSFGRVRPSKHGQITILSSISRKPRFSEKHRKSTLQGLIFDPKVAKISAGATKNRKHPPKNSFLTVQMTDQILDGHKTTYKDRGHRTR